MSIDRSDSWSENPGWGGDPCSLPPERVSSSAAPQSPVAAALLNLAGLALTYAFLHLSGGMIHVGWFKDKLFGSRWIGRPGQTGRALESRTLRPSRAWASAFKTGLCDSCNIKMKVADGYYLTTREVAMSEAYWVMKFADMKKFFEPLSSMLTEELFQISVRNVASDTTAWGICETCSEFFIFNRDEANYHAVKKTEPSGSGAIDPAQCAHVAARAWEQVFSQWPTAVEQPASDDSCDICRKKIYVSELTGFIPEETLGDYLARGFLDDSPGTPPRSGGDDMGWIMCGPCMARLLAWIHRSNHRNDADI